MKVTYDLCAGIAFVCSRVVILRDLKPDNILLGKTDKFWNAVIADFGNNAIVQQTQAASAACAAVSRKSGGKLRAVT